MLLVLTLITTGLVVAALVVYLLLSIRLLVAAQASVREIANGLEAVQRHTRPLDEKLVTINGAMSALLESLRDADRHLGRAAGVFRL